MPDCRLTETPSAAQLIGPNHYRSLGLSTCHMTLYISTELKIIAASPCTWTQRGRGSDAPLWRTLPEYSSLGEGLPNCTDTPIVQLAASPTACNGVEAGSVCLSVSIVVIPSWTTHNRGRVMLCWEAFPARSSIFPLTFSLWITFLACKASNEAGSLNV
ncbi:hypothetical protein CHARACLAT_007256 [Characodon lateralis]|uniref:Uncharacterized protein n=1 Tax=Characodon lateralis TaxID=208331 RepID=A0ABU7EB15_9TELE|nr:hypothetical protein [Characodon lateralis]